LEGLLAAFGAMEGVHASMDANRFNIDATFQSASNQVGVEKKAGRRLVRNFGKCACCDEM
jgi:hypothetical protein